MIHKTLDNQTEPLLTPEAVYGKHEKICDACVITFSYKVMEWALRHLDCEQVTEIGCCNGNRSVYLTEWKGRKVVFYMSLVSAPGAAACLEEKRVSYVTGRTWTTDAVYRETSGKAERLRKDGCIAVEMELAGMQAVCEYHGLALKA